MSNPIDYEMLEARVEQGVQRQKTVARYVLLLVNILFFIIFMGIAWGTALLTPEFRELSSTAGESLMLILTMSTIGWFTALIMHLTSVLVDSGLGDKQIRGQIVARELGQQMLEQRRSMTEKPKRDETGGRLVLGEDGELQHIEDDADDLRAARSGH